MIGPTGVGKSTIMNELYGFDASSPGECSVLSFSMTIENEDYGLYIFL